VELTPFAAGIDPSRKPIEKGFVVVTPDQRRLELSGIDADEGCSKPVGDEATGELLGIHPPEREDTALAGPGEERFAVTANVLKEEVAEGDLFDTREIARCQRIEPTLLVEAVRAPGGNGHCDKGQAERPGLAFEEGAPNAVHADTVVFGRDGRDERRQLDTLPLTQNLKREHGILASAP
jgi:hypothetical protein